MDIKKRVLDPCCGSKMFWFDREHTEAIYGDIRTEECILCDGRVLKIQPDLVMDFTNLPFGNNTFSLVVFDPPHLITVGEKSWLARKYGKLPPDWREDITRGFSECFRVLSNNGVLVFKWSESQIKVREVLDLTTVKPLFGHPTGRKGLTHWIVFIKPLEGSND